MPLLNRRDWLQAMLVGSAGALFPFGSKASALAGRVLGLPVGMAASDGPAPYWLVQPLRTGSDVGHGWSLADLSPVERGAAVLTLAHADGGQARVHLCHRGSAPRGIAHSEHLDFVLMNGHDGSAPSDEHLGLVILSLARRVSRNERLASAQLAQLHGLMPHAERVRVFGAESLT